MIPFRLPPSFYIHLSKTEVYVEDAVELVQLPLIQEKLNAMIATLKGLPTESLLHVRKTPLPHPSTRH
jgi:hypothetical protein